MFTCKCECHNMIIDDPKQLRIDFGYHPISANYTDGYKSGKHWDANWMPGGPWVYPSFPNDKDADKRKHIDSIRNREEWLEGFDRGLAERFTDSPTFAAWWKENYNSNNHRRFVDPTVDNP